jgi:hypothetical protein
LGYYLALHRAIQWHNEDAATIIYARKAQPGLEGSSALVDIESIVERAAANPTDHIECDVVASWYLSIG